MYHKNPNFKQASYAALSLAILCYGPLPSATISSPIHASYINYPSSSSLSSTILIEAYFPSLDIEFINNSVTLV